MIDLEDVIEQRHANYFRNKKVATDKAIETAQKKVTDQYEREIIKPILDSDEIEGYDDEASLVLQSETLKGYVDDLFKLQQEAASTAASESDDKKNN